MIQGGQINLETLYLEEEGIRSFENEMPVYKVNIE